MLISETSIIHTIHENTKLNTIELIQNKIYMQVKTGEQLYEVKGYFQ